jgi:IS30 family transposase
MATLTTIGVAMTYTHLTIDERYQIDSLRGQGFNQKEIAELLGRNKSTISRELRRNKGERVWRAKQAHNQAVIRLQERNRNNTRKICMVAWNEAQKMLIENQCSPEQISGRLKLSGKERISRESIYRRILEDKRAGGSLYKNLRSQKQRRSRYGSKRQGYPNILNRKGIEERPSIVDKRKRIGDFEGDTIIGAGCDSGIILSAVDRKSRYTLLNKLPNKDPINVSQTFIKRTKKFKKLMHTLTLDNGGEFTKHEIIAKELGIDVYFARPYRSYERGTIENTNGLVRQYFKKGQRFDNITDADVQIVANKLNHRPRKCLNFKTPYEVFVEELIKKGVALCI